MIAGAVAWAERVVEHRRRALAGFDVVRDIDGTPAEVSANRQDRHAEHQS
jgi:hypothetical protein